MGAFVLWESTPTEERLDLKSKGYDGFKSLLSYHCAVSEVFNATVRNPVIHRLKSDSGVHFYGGLMKLQAMRVLGTRAERRQGWSPWSPTIVLPIWWSWYTQRPQNAPRKHTGPNPVIGTKIYRCGETSKHTTRDF